MLLLGGRAGLGGARRRPLLIAFLSRLLLHDGANHQLFDLHRHGHILMICIREYESSSVSMSRFFWVASRSDVDHLTGNARMNIQADTGSPLSLKSVTRTFEGANLKSVSAALNSMLSGEPITMPRSRM